MSDQEQGAQGAEKTESKREKAPVQGILPGDERYENMEFTTQQKNPATNLDD